MSDETSLGDAIALSDVIPRRRLIATKTRETPNRILVLLGVSANTRFAVICDHLSQVATSDRGVVRD